MIIFFRKAGRASRLPPLSRQERAVVRAIQGAIDKVKEETVRSEVTKALERDDVNAAVRAVKIAEGEAFLRSVLPRQYRDAYDLAGEESVNKLKLDMAFDVVNPNGVEFARQRSGQMITEWGNSSREALTTLVKRSIDDGIPTKALGKMIVESGIGLTERQAVAVERLRVSLEENEDVDLSQDQIDFRVAKYSRELLRQRGETIARTEIILANREGEQESWRQAIEQGFLDEDSFQQEWSVADDERLCDVCGELDGEQIGLDDKFPGGLDGPPAHPNCRCSLIARFKRI